MKEFTQEKIKQVCVAIDKALDSGAEPIAAFDADGTLWSNDVGENLFHYQAKEGLLPDLPPNPWEYYLKVHEDKGPLAGFLWLAQINAGLSLQQVRKWAEEAIQVEKPLIFPEQQQIIEHLHKRGVVVYVVTASIKWAVEPAAKLYNIPFDQVIGVQTKVENGIITNQQEGHITYREGKLTALLAHTNNKSPFYCAGNSKGDATLLEGSSHLRFVMASAPQGHRMHEQEQSMIKRAKSENWLWHSYV